MIADSGEVYRDVFSCQDFSGVTSAVPVGVYEVRVDLLNEGQRLVARSNPRFVHVWGKSTEDSVGLAFEFKSDRGSIRLSWDLNCDDTDSVEVVIDGEVALTTSCWFTIEYPWVDVPDVPLGPHAIAASAITASGDVLATSATQNHELEFGNQRLELLAEF